MPDHRIAESDFLRRFEAAVDAAVTFAATMVQEDLPSLRAFHIEPNASFDEHPLEDDQRLFPHDAAPAGGLIGPLSSEAAAAWFWREGRVPEWIDVSVCQVAGGSTVIHLTSCGRFTSLERRLYYGSTGLAPFGVKSPVQPVEWKSATDSGRFSLRPCPGKHRA